MSAQGKILSRLIVCACHRADGQGGARTELDKLVEPDEREEPRDYTHSLTDTDELVWAWWSVVLCVFAPHALTL